MVSSQAELQSALNTAGSGDVVLFSTTPDNRPRTITITSGLTGAGSGFDIDGTTIPNRVGVLVPGSGGNYPILNMGSNNVAQVRNIEMNDGRFTGTGNGGGAITVATITNGIRNAAFRRNSSSIGAGGGAIYVNGPFHGLITQDIHFDSNIANGNGGALHINGDFFGSLDGTGGDVHFDRNIAGGDGGGMYVLGNFGTAGRGSRIYANYFANNEAGRNGGGLYVGGTFDGDLAAYSFFDSNHADGDGGGIWVGGVINGGVHGSPFTNNTAGGSGGGMHLNIMNGSIDSGSYFNNNKANGGDGGAIMIAGTSASPGDVVMNGDIRANFSNNAATGNGGAVAVGSVLAPIVTYSGNIGNRNFTQNQAGGSGGALYVKGGLLGIMTNSSFTGNAAVADGGAIYAGDGLTIFAMTNSSFSQNSGRNGGALCFNQTQNVYINDTTIQDNRAGGNGGGIYFNTDNAASGGPYRVNLSASAGKTTNFGNNASSGGNNSFYFGGNATAANVILNVAGDGNVNLFDVFTVNMLGGTGNAFTLTKGTPAGTFLMSGINNITVQNGTAAVNLGSGNTNVRSDSVTNADYAMRFNGNTNASVTLGTDHHLTILDLGSRQYNNAVFDFKNSGSKDFVIQRGTILDITRILSPLPNHKYLLVDGLAPGSTPNVANFVYLHPDGYHQIPLVEANGTQIWLDLAKIPDAFDPKTTAPNVVAAQNCLDYWLNKASASLHLSPYDVIALRRDFASATAEAAVSFVNIGLGIHSRAVDAANHNAFGRDTLLYGLNDGFAAAANPGREASSIIGGWQPAATAGSNQALAQLPVLARRGPRFWTGYFGSFDRANKLNGYSGYDTDTNGGMLGAAWDLSEAFSIGGFAGYSHSETDYGTSGFRRDGATRKT